VITAGYYQVNGELYDRYGDHIGWESNYTYLNAGNQTVQLDFDGVKIRQNGVNGTYNLKYLSLHDDHWNQLDYVYDAYITSYYNYTEFQRPPAEFSDIYSDYGADTDGDGFYDYLIIDVGVDVMMAGKYRIEGSLYDEYEYSIEYDSSYTYLNTGNQTVTLAFSGTAIRQHDVDGHFHLKYLHLYDENYNQLDYLYDAYTTSYYNCTDFQRISEFNGNFSDNGTDTDDDGLYDNLTISVGVYISDAGYHRVSGDLYSEYGYPIGSDSRYTYLNTGDHIVQLNFDGATIRQHGVNGTYKLQKLCLYEGQWNQLDYIYDAYTTSYYNYTDFEDMPPEISNISMSPRYPNVNTTVTVAATITDDTGVNVSRIYYSTDNEIWSDVAMNNSDDLYSGRILGFAETTTVYYYISAIDHHEHVTNSNVSTYIADGAPPYFEDVTIDPPHPNTTTNVTVYSDIRDNVGIANATLWYSYDDVTWHNTTISGISPSSDEIKSDTGSTTLYCDYLYWDMYDGGRWRE
jgi:hypothetical protein